MHHTLSHLIICYDPFLDRANDLYVIWCPPEHFTRFLSDCNDFLLINHDRNDGGFVQDDISSIVY